MFTDSHPGSRTGAGSGVSMGAGVIEGGTEVSVGEGSGVRFEVTSGDLLATADIVDGVVLLEQEVPARSRGTTITRGIRE
jgi:hypothetical protein